MKYTHTARNCVIGIVLSALPLAISTEIAPRYFSTLPTQEEQSIEITYDANQDKLFGLGTIIREEEKILAHISSGFTGSKSLEQLTTSNLKESITAANHVVDSLQNENKAIVDSDLYKSSENKGSRNKHMASIGLILTVLGCGYSLINYRRKEDANKLAGRK